MINSVLYVALDLLYSRTYSCVLNRYYLRNWKGQLINAPYVDNSYKWAGGGFISTTEDLVKFGNVMLYASQVEDYQGKAKDSLLPGLSALDNKNTGCMIKWWNSARNEAINQ